MSNKLTSLQLFTIMDTLALIKPEVLPGLTIDVRSPEYSNGGDKKLVIDYMGIQIPTNTAYLYEDKLVFFFKDGHNFEVLL